MLPPDFADRLLALHWPDAQCELRAKDAWELLVAAILSARTSDARVNQVMATITEHILGPQALADSDPRRLAELIRKVPLHAQKARRIVEAARAIVYRYDGKVPEDEAALLRLPGVGRKTAAVVLGNAFGQAAVAADAHVQRILRRWDWTRQEDAMEAEMALRQALPPARWVQACHQLIRLGREHCRPLKPWCSRCPFLEQCPQAGVEDAR